MKLAYIVRLLDYAKQLLYHSATVFLQLGMRTTLHMSIHFSGAYGDQFLSRLYPK